LGANVAVDREILLSGGQNQISLTSCNIPIIDVSNPKMTEDRALVSRIMEGDSRLSGWLIKQNERLVAHMVAGSLIARKTGKSFARTCS